MRHHPSIRVVLITIVESHLINIHDFQIFQPISIKDDGIQGVLLDTSQSLPGALKWLLLLSRCLFQCLLLLLLLLLLFSSPRVYLSFTFSHHQTFVLIMLKLLFLLDRHCGIHLPRASSGHSCQKVGYSQNSLFCSLFF